MKLAHDPLVDPEILNVIEQTFHGLSIDSVAIDQWDINRYLNEFTKWLENSRLHTMQGLDQYSHRAYCTGTSQAIESFIYRHCRNKRIRFSQAEFILEKIVSNSIGANWAYLEDEFINKDDAVLVSLPFAGNGGYYPRYQELINTCNQLGVPVLLDLAYFGISQGINFDLDQPCITDVVCSLSKCMSVQLRLGIRYTRVRYDDAVQNLSELKIINRIAAEVGIQLLQKFSSEYIISKYSSRYEQICLKNNLTPTNTITLAIDNNNEFFRNGYYRVCVTDELL